MKICIITSLYKPYARGGAENVVENIVNGLIGEGNNVVVITTKPLKLTLSNKILKLHTPNPSQEGDNLKIIRLYPWNLFWFGNINEKPVWLRLPWHVIDIFNLHSYFKIKKILKKEKPDVVMTHNLKGIGYTVPMVIRSTGIRHIHTLHDVQLVEPSGLLFQKNKKTKPACAGRKQENKILKKILIKIYSWINIKLFGSPDIIISPSKWLLQFYVEKEFFKRSKKIVVKNPITDSPPFIKGDSVEFSTKSGSAVANLNLLYIGQIEAHKGILFLIDAVKKIANIHLDIVGAGTKLEEIQELAKGSDNIKIHGYAENNLLNKFFVQSDFLIVPSLCYENAPIVIYESFANGVPVIASNIGGVPELVEEGYNGYIFEAGNEESLKRAIQKCIIEKNKWGELRQNALRSVEGWGIEEYIEKLMFKIENI